MLIYITWLLVVVLSALVVFAVVLFTVVVFTVVVFTVVVLTVVVPTVVVLTVVVLTVVARSLPVQQQAPGRGFWSVLQGIRHKTRLHSWKCGWQSTIYPISLKSTISHNKYLRPQVFEKFLNYVTLLWLCK
jgi:hypothetical protein